MTNATKMSMGWGLGLMMLAICVFPVNADVDEKASQYIFQLLSDKSYPEAEAQAKLLVQQLEAIHGKNHPKVAEALYLLSYVYTIEGKNFSSPEVTSVHQRLMEIAENSTDKKTRVFKMNWKYGDPSPEWPDAKHIILSFVKYPNHVVGIYSNDLGKYLESLKAGEIEVKFEVTTDKLSGQMMSYHVAEIGRAESWQSYNSYGGTAGEAKPSPWDELNDQ